MNAVRVVDFFSGCGGTSLGFRDAGLEVALGLDHDPSAAATFRRNFPEAAFVEADIRTLSTDEVLELAGPGPHLFAGCAPCQPFSNQNRHRKSGDPRRRLLAEFQRFVDAGRPEYIVVENVPGAQQISGKKGPLDKFAAQLKAWGYDVNSAVLRAGDFGVPQRRRRLVLVASRVGEATLPEPGAGQPTVREAIAHLRPLSAGEVDPLDPDHASARLSTTNLQRIRSTPEGGGRGSWPAHLMLPCHDGHDGHTDVYGRMSWDRPAPGLTTKCLSYSNGRFGHPDQDRAISAREAACLQTFPDDFHFEGWLTEKARQIGNAVPPVFAAKIAAALVGTSPLG